MAEVKNEWVYTSAPPYTFEVFTVLTLPVPQETFFFERRSL
jgi:hypothetical protein